MAHANLEPPTLSEVIRIMEAIQIDIRTMGSRTLSNEIYANDKLAHDREIKEMKADIITLQQEKIQAEQQRKSARWGYLAIVIGGFIAIYLAPLLQLPFQK